MADVIELINSRATDIQDREWRQTRLYRVTDADSVQQALQAVYQETPYQIAIGDNGTYPAFRVGRRIQRIALSKVWDVETDFAGSTVDTEEPEIDWSVSFSGATGTQKAVYALETIAKDEAAPETDYFGLNENGEPEGTDIDDTRAAMVITCRLPAAQLSPNDLRQFAAKKDQVNEAPFMGFGAGELKYGMPSLSWRPGSDWQISMTFQIAITQRNLSIKVRGADVTIPELQGWDYLDLRYQRKVVPDPAAPETRSVVVPEVAYWQIKRLYQRSDFATIFSSGVLQQFGASRIPSMDSFGRSWTRSQSYATGDFEEGATYNSRA